MLVSWNWLQDYLGETKLTAQQAAELLGTHAFELERVVVTDEDTIIDVDVLPNRSSDCLSHRGIAHELAVITDTPLAFDPLQTPPQLATTDQIKVTIVDPQACPRFTASLITDVTVKPSPEWLQRRLRAIGQRPINNIVDATNYVMFALGQPLHAYDADLFPQHEGAWQFTVRRARVGEIISLLPEGEKEVERIVELTGSELLIVDGSSDTPIGLAGVKGGAFAGVHSGTKNIIIEAAHFDPTLTRQTARGLGIVIDASKRFENEPARDLPEYAQAAIVALIKDIAGGSFVGWVDEYLTRKTNPTVMFRPARAVAMLGVDIPPPTMQSILARIGATVVSDGDTWQVTGPWERTDLLLEEDLIEEVGRIYGYEHIAAVAPERQPLTAVNAQQYYSEQIRTILLAEGFSEVITSSFRPKDQIQLANALASDKSYLRSNLRKNITEVLDRNATLPDLLGTTDTRVFELGTVFSKDEEQGLVEHTALAVGVRTKSTGYSGKEDKIVEATLTKLNELIGVTPDWHIEQGVAECNLTALLTALPTPSGYEPVASADPVTYRPFSVYPFVTRDIALWVDVKLSAAEVQAEIDAHAGPLRVRTTLFDEFSKDGRTSFAFRLVFQSHEKTLDGSEVDGYMQAIYDAATKAGWEVR